MPDLTRRQLLQALACAPALAAVGARAGDSVVEPAPPRRRLLLVELNGGNDSLNTVIPYADPLYPQLRPELAIARDQVLALDEQVGLHPALEPLRTIFADGELAIVQGLGYPAPNRSHFRSIEIWDTASDADQYLQDGWLAGAEGRLRARAGYSAHGAVIGRNPLPLSGAGLNTVALRDSGQFMQSAGRISQPPEAAATPALAHVIRVQRGIREAAAGLSSEPRPHDFPQSAIGRNLAEAARLLKQPGFAPVIKVAQSGYDTHANQARVHERLLRELAEGLTALRRDLREAGLWQRTLVLTYSEFGRRARENGSRGTDHGAAAAHFALGGAVAGGLYGAQPSLGDLDEGDLRHAVDFRRYYNTVISRWWGFPDLMIGGIAHPPLDFV